MMGEVSGDETASDGGNVGWGAGLLFFTEFSNNFIYSSALAPRGLPCQFSASSIPKSWKKY